jgi:hypothetical protein
MHCALCMRQRVACSRERSRCEWASCAVHRQHCMRACCAALQFAWRAAELWTTTVRVRAPCITACCGQARTETGSVAHGQNAALVHTTTMLSPRQAPHDTAHHQYTPAASQQAHTHTQTHEMQARTSAMYRMCALDAAAVGSAVAPAHPSRSLADSHSARRQQGEPVQQRRLLPLGSAHGSSAAACNVTPAPKRRSPHTLRRATPSQDHGQSCGRARRRPTSSTAARLCFTSHSLVR